MSYENSFESRKKGFSTTTKLLAGGGLAAVFMGAVHLTGLSPFYVVDRTEVAIETLFGQIVEQEDEPGITLKNPLSGVERFPLTQQDAVIGEGTEMRTGDELRLAVGMTAKWAIRQGSDIRILGENLPKDGGTTALGKIVNKIFEDAGIRAAESLSINDIITPTDLNPAQEDAEEAATFTTLLKERTQRFAQEELNVQGWPVEIITVLTSGFHFIGEETEARLAEVVGLRQEELKLKLREQNADQARKTLEKEAAADSAYILPLLADGISPEAAISALCIVKSTGAHNAPFTPGCFGGASNVSAAIDPNNVTIGALQEQDAPEPGQ